MATHIALAGRLIECIFHLFSPCTKCFKFVLQTRVQALVYPLDFWLYSFTVAFIGVSVALAVEAIPPTNGILLNGSKTPSSPLNALFKAFVSWAIL